MCAYGECGRVAVGGGVLCSRCRFDVSRGGGVVGAWGDGGGGCVGGMGGGLASGEVCVRSGAE